MLELFNELIKPHDATRNWVNLYIFYIVFKEKFDEVFTQDNSFEDFCIDYVNSFGEQANQVNSASGTGIGARLKSLADNLLAQSGSEPDKVKLAFILHGLLKYRYCPNEPLGSSYQGSQTSLYSKTESNIQRAESTESKATVMRDHSPRKRMLSRLFPVTEATSYNGDLYSTPIIKLNAALTNYNPSAQHHIFHEHRPSGGYIRSWLVMLELAIKYNPKQMSGDPATTHGSQAATAAAR